LFEFSKIKWEVDCKNGSVYEKENKLNTIVNEESEVRGKNISSCHDFALCSKFKLQTKHFSWTSI
jgi:hypothetical protein